MKIGEYFDSKGILWFPINLTISGEDEAGKKEKRLEPYNEEGRRPDYTKDFDNISLVNQRKKYKNYIYGGVDTRQFQHIDVDLLKNKEYSQETIEFVENLKQTHPYFLSVGKRKPHFIVKNGNLGGNRFGTKYDDIEILNGQWSYFRINSRMKNTDKSITELDKSILKKIKKTTTTTKKKSKKNMLNEPQTKQADVAVDPLLNNIVENLDIKYIDDYHIWIRLVFGLHNDNLGNYELAKKMSMRSNKYEEDFFNKLWSNSKVGATIGTIHYYSMKSNFKRYVALNPNDHLTGTDDNLAKIFINMEYENLHYNQDSKIIYIYTNNKWILDHKPYLKLKKTIREKLKLYVKEEIFKLLGNEITENIAKDLEVKRKILQKVESKKTNDNVCSFVIEELASLDKEEVFDTGREQYYNLHFQNGVYNIKDKKFRKRTKDDKITKILNWDYLENVPQSKIDNVNLFFKKLHADEEQRKFSLSWLAYCLTGNTGLQKFKMNIGYSSNNGKSTEFNIHSTVFPIYSKKLDNRTFSIAYESKRHKQLLPLIREPIRFLYSEELDQIKIDAALLKEVVEGSDLTVEVLYGLTETSQIQCKLNTCSNKDFNIEMDNGVLRRGLVQLYSSTFKYDIKDDWDKREFLRMDNWYLIFEDEEYKNAYLHILLSHFSLNNFIPKKNEEQFKNIAEEYDEFGNIFEELFELTKHPSDFIYKNEVLKQMNLRDKKITLRQIRNEFKKKSIKYDRKKMVKSKQGFFIGIKLKEIEDEDETDDEE